MRTKVCFITNVCAAAAMLPVAAITVTICYASTHPLVLLPLMCMSVRAHVMFFDHLVVDF